jgi:NAD(P)H-hydrate epimerase
VDADALNLLARQPKFNNNWVLTPHPGEAARLLNCSTIEVQQDRFAAIKAMQKKYGGVVVLKGYGTLIASDKDIVVSNTGNPGMASGGMGDVLSGVIAGLLAQGVSQIQAAQQGVYVHGEAADLAVANLGERGLLAGDLMIHLRKLVNQ